LKEWVYIYRYRNLYKAMIMFLCRHARAGFVPWWLNSYKF
jgi:hypothetical protein